MDFALSFLVLCLAGLVWFWSDSLRALEAARGAGKQACCNAGVQFLDDTVARTALALVRDGTGRRVLHRTYRFEFSATGNDRLEGQLELLGNEVTQITMEPYQIRPEVESGQPLEQQPFRQFW